MRTTIYMSNFQKQAANTVSNSATTNRKHLIIWRHLQLIDRYLFGPKKSRTMYSYFINLPINPLMLAASFSDGGKQWDWEREREQVSYIERGDYILYDQLAQYEWRRRRIVNIRGLYQCPLSPFLADSNFAVLFTTCIADSNMVNSRFQIWFLTHSTNWTSSKGQKWNL